MKWLCLVIFTWMVAENNEYGSYISATHSKAVYNHSDLLYVRV